MNEIIYVYIFKLIKVIAWLVKKSIPIMAKKCVLKDGSDWLF